MPPNIVDVVTRDRRWAQGNLQHLAIVSQPGITAMGRVHLGMGAASYLVSAVWAASLIVGIVLALQGQQMIPSYFRDAKTLFPIWPVIDPGAALRLFLATLAVVMLPKILGLLLEWKKARKARDLSHALRSTVGVAYETVFSMLVAPILMVTQTVGAIQILIGIDSGWKAQKRDDGALSFKDSFWFARWHTVTGLVSGALAYAASPQLLLWMSPVILGLVLAAPIIWLTSHRADPVSRWLLSTFEERSPPPILKAANERAAEWALRLPRVDANADLPQAA
jgi:membrane glycosyltransferase